MSLLKILIVILIACSCLSTHSQVIDWDCVYTWTPGAGIGSIVLQPIPEPVVLNAAPGAELTFSIRFSDLDEVTGNGETCVDNNSHNRECQPFGHQVTFLSSNSNFASFNELNSAIGEITTNVHVIGPFGGAQVISSENVELFINEGWTESDPPITITVTISDNTMLPAGAMGNCQDPPVMHQWNINFNDLCPMSMSQIVGAPNNTWVTLPFVNPNFMPVFYTYQFAPDIGAPGSPDYEGINILEQFGPPVSGGIFTLEHLKPDWIANNGVVNADQAAAILFMPAQNALFSIDQNDQIEDGHGVFNPNTVSAFTNAAISTNHAGFQFNQDYSCNGTVVGSAIISKRAFNAGGYLDFQVRKENNF